MSHPSPADLLADVGRACYGPRWRVALARALGVDDDTVRRWMTGRTELSLDHGIWPLALETIEARRHEIAAAEAALTRALKRKKRPAPL